MMTADGGGAPVWSAGLAGQSWRHRSRRLVATDHPNLARQSGETWAARRCLCARGRPEPPVTMWGIFGRGDEAPCKPDSVRLAAAPQQGRRQAGDHPSATAVASGLPSPRRCGLPGSLGAGRPLPRPSKVPGLLGLAPGGVCLAAWVAPGAGGLLHRRFTLTHRKRRAVCFLWHFPAGHPGWVLPTTVPCGVRTFLDALAPRSPGGLVAAQAYRPGCPHKTAAWPIGIRSVGQCLLVVSRVVWWEHGNDVEA